jgi:asparagine synthase (glutamine-hydrolysing)
MGAIFGYAGNVLAGTGERALELMSHRGSSRRQLLVRPDLLLAEASGAGERREQVAKSRDGSIACVMDGHLFNRRELEAELEPLGAARCDAEIVAELFRRSSVAAFGALDGPFALGLSDGETLHVVRDALGEKPLYYAPKLGAGFAFASESKAFFADPDFVARPNLAALNRLLAFSFIPGRETALQGVFELEPGTRLSLALAGGEPKVERYWELEERIEPRDEAEWTELLGQALRAAVQRRLPAENVPIGAFLSGGIDSSAVVALLAELGRRPTCYSLSFGVGEPNELLYATMVTAHCDLPHRVLDVEPADFIDLLPRIMWCLDDPLCDCITVPNYILAQTAGREVPVIFNGEGGDPLFGGPKNKFMILGEWYSELGGYERKKAYLASYHKFYDHLAELSSDEFLAATGGPAALERDVEEFLENSRVENFLNRLMHINIRLKGGQNILVKVDKMLSPSGVQAASPLFDKKLTELSFSIPASLKRKGDVEKYVFKKSVEGLLPRPVVYRKKAGMGVPLNQWFRKAPLRRFTRELLTSQRARERGYFRPEFVDGLLAGGVPDGHVGRDRTGELTWMLLALEIWHRVFVDGERP